MNEKTVWRAVSPAPPSHAKLEDCVKNRHDWCFFLCIFLDISPYFILFPYHNFSIVEKKKSHLEISGVESCIYITVYKFSSNLCCWMHWYFGVPNTLWQSSTFELYPMWKTTSLILQHAAWWHHHFLKTWSNFKKYISYQFSVRKKTSFQGAPDCLLAYNSNKMYCTKLILFLI